MTHPTPPPEISPKKPLSKQENTPSIIVRFGGIALAIIITIVVFTFRNQLQEDEIKKYGYAGLFVISVIGNATIVLPVPTFVAAFAGGSVLNPFWVGVVSAAGAAIGEMTGYLAGISGNTIIENKEAYNRAKAWIDRHGLLTLFILAAIPNPLFDMAGIIAGMMRIPIFAFFLVTWAGKIIKFWLLALLGSNSLDLFEQIKDILP